MIKLIKSTFFHENRTKNALCAFIKKSKQLSIGQYCEKFEKTFASWQNRKFCVLFNTGSSANLALIQALLNIGLLKKGMRVGFSGITWATNVMPLLQLGLKPIPIDIEIATLNVSPKTLQNTHQIHKLDCVFLTNLLGFSDDIRAIKKYCTQHRILLLEDNCESLGSVVRHTLLGNFGLASSFSFFVGHHMSAIEGGAVCTDNPMLNQALRMVRSHGWDRHLSKKEQEILRKKYNITDFEAKYTFYDLAYNLRPTEITGFLGLHQLRYLTQTIKRREKIFHHFHEVIKRNSLFHSLHLNMDRVSNFAMPIICTTKEVKERCVRLCKKNGIEVRPIVGGVMSDQPFFRKYVKKVYNLPNARLIHQNGFYFANNPELTKDEIRKITTTIKQV